MCGLGLGLLGLLKVHEFRALKSLGAKVLGCTLHAWCSGPQLQNTNLNTPNLNPKLPEFLNT